MTSSKADKALKGVSDIFLGQIASKIFTFLFLIIFVRLLSLEELASLPLYYAASGAATLLFSMGIPVTFIREVPRLRVADPDKMHSLLFTGFVVVMAGVVMSAFLAYLLKEPIRALLFSDLGGLIDTRLFTLAMVAGGWKTIMTFVLKSLQMYRGMAIFTVSNDLLYRALGLIGYFLAGINGLLAGFLLGTLIINIYCTWRVSDFLFSTRKWYPVRELLKISWPYYFEAYLHYFRAQGDVLIVSSLLGSSALAVFFVAKRLYDLMMTIIASMEQVMAPSLSQLLGHSMESAVKGYSRMAALVPVVVIPMGLLAAGLSYAFIDVVGGRAYAESAYITAALFCGVTILHSLVAMRIHAIYVFGRPVDRMKITLGQFTVYFSFLYLLVAQFGIMGAPIAQAISYIVASIYAGKMLIKYMELGKPSNIVWIILGVSLIGLALLVGLQIYLYSIYLIPVYLAVTAFGMIVLVTILSPEREFQELKVALPPRLRGVFDSYMCVRAKLLQSSNGR